MDTRVLLIVTATLLSALPCMAGNRDDVKPSLPWGAGAYGLGRLGGHDLDMARWDWVACHSGDVCPEQLKFINHLLEINPRQKYLFQLTGGLLADGLPQHGNKMNFLDYHFDAKRRESFLVRLKSQIELLLTTLAKPRNIAALTFYEELPGHWGEWHLLRPAAMRQSAPATQAAEDTPRAVDVARSLDPFPAFLKPYQPHIERERGQPLVWNEETWRYLGQIYLSTLNDIHRHIKEYSGNLPVYYWLHNGMATLDMLPPDWTFDNATGTECSVKLSDIIQPGVCDGLMFYPSTVERWQVMRPLFEKHNWRYFGQLWHPGAMRLDTWDATVTRLKDPNPWNQGYFFYCEGGGCARPSDLNDPDMMAAEARIRQRCITPVVDEREGSAMRIANTDPDGLPFNHQYFSEVHPKNHIQGGRTYLWSLHMRTNDIQDSPRPSGRGAVFMMRWFNKTAQIREDWLVSKFGTNDWQTFSGQIKAPEDAVDCAFFLMLWRATGEAWFTQLSLKLENDDREWVGNGCFDKAAPSPFKFDYWYHVDDTLALSHRRWFCNKHHVGDDVVARYFKLDIQLDKPREGMQAGRPVEIAATLTNTRDAGLYEDPKSADAHQVEARLIVPAGMKLVEPAPTDATTLTAGASLQRQWKVIADQPGTYILRAESHSADMPGSAADVSVVVE
ncbi:MAG: hypothetical protein IT440_15350 [Phycisphaeraceae bacterium]|nr:hypothetical protein [Phycisphaeraceae bacterium]